MALAKLDVWGGHQIPVIRYRGTYSWPGLYRLLRGWIEENRFNYFETKYKHKGDEVEVDMVGERKIDAMHKYIIKVGIHLWELKTIEVAEGTKTVKKNTGRVQVIIEGSVEVDYQGRFKGSKTAETLGKWWFAVTKKDTEFKHADPHTYHLYQLHEKVKNFLNMTTDSNAY